MQLEEAIKLWKKLGVSKCVMDFSCGGDSMGDTSFLFFDENDEEIDGGELENYFDDKVYSNVDFYVNSDGHYQGESGTVEIELVEDGDELYFSYSKNSRSEWSESVEEVIDVELSPKAIKFIQENVSNMNGEEGGGVVVNYKREFIMTDEQEEIQGEIEEKVEIEACNFVPELSDDDELQDWFTFTTNSDEHRNLKELTIVDNILKVSIRKSYTTFKDE